MHKPQTPNDGGPTSGPETQGAPRLNFAPLRLFWGLPQLTGLSPASPRPPSSYAWALGRSEGLRRGGGGGRPGPGSARAVRERRAGSGRPAGRRRVQSPKPARPGLGDPREGGQRGRQSARPLHGGGRLAGAGSRPPGGGSLSLAEGFETEGPGLLQRGLEPGQGPLFCKAWIAPTCGAGGAAAGTQARAVCVRILARTRSPPLCAGHPGPGTRTRDRPRRVGLPRRFRAQFVNSRPRPQDSRVWPARRERTRCSTVGRGGEAAEREGAQGQSSAWKGRAAHCYLRSLRPQRPGGLPAPVSPPLAHGGPSLCLLALVSPFTGRVTEVTGQMYAWLRPMEKAFRTYINSD